MRSKESRSLTRIEAFALALGLIVLGIAVARADLGPDPVPPPAAFHGPENE